MTNRVPPPRLPRFDFFPAIKNLIVKRLFAPLLKIHEGEMPYTAILRLKPEPSDGLGIWKPSKAFDAASEGEAISAAFEWKDKNSAEGYEVQELWLFEDACKTMLWCAEELEIGAAENASA